MSAIVSRLTKAVDAVVWQAMALGTRSARPLRLHRRRIRMDRTEAVWRTRSSSSIEPQWGYLILRGRRLCTSGFETLRGVMPLWTYALPSPVRWLRSGGRPTIEMDRVISLRHLYEWNYFHFFFDVLGKLALLDRLGMLEDVPIVVGPSAGELHFARELMQTGSFASLNWFVQPRGTYIHAREVTFCRSRLPWADRARFVVDRLDLPPLAADEPEHRVLLVRRPPAVRTIINADEVEAIATSARFQTVDTSDWSLTDQIELFRRTRTLIAVHGAGMTNMIFRSGAPLDVVELCSDVWHPNGLRDAALQLGFGFHRLSFPPGNEDDPQSADFSVDPDRLRAALADLGISPATAP